jgi:hypothetical protein
MVASRLVAVRAFVDAFDTLPAWWERRDAAQAETVIIDVNEIPWR